MELYNYLRTLTVDLADQLEGTDNDDLPLVLLSLLLLVMIVVSLATYAATKLSTFFGTVIRMGAPDYKGYCKGFINNLDRDPDSPLSNLKRKLPEGK